MKNNVNDAHWKVGVIKSLLGMTDEDGKHRFEGNARRELIETMQRVVESALIDGNDIVKISVLRSVIGIEGYEAKSERDVPDGLKDSRLIAVLMKLVNKF